MHTRNISVGRQTPVDRNRPARQAGRRRGRRPLRRHHGARDRLCRRRTRAKGIDFLPLTVDYREYTYASGRIPGGFFKREGKPTEKEVLTSRSSIARSARSSRRAGGTRRRSSRWCSRPTPRTTPTCSRSPAPRRRWRCRAFRSRRRSPASASASSTASTSSTRPSSSAKSRPRPDRRRQQGRDRDGRSGRQGSHREEEIVRRSSARTRRSARSSPASTRWRKDVGKKKREVAEEGDRPTRSTARSRRRSTGRSTEAMRIKDKLENYGRVDRCSTTCSPSIPEDDVEREATPRRSSRS